MKGLVLVLFLGILSISSVMATTTLSSKNYWTEWQNTEANTGYSTMSGHFPNISLTTSVPYGSAFQPLIVDIDSDGVNEIIGSSGTILKIWTTSSNLITLKNELIVGTQAKSMAMVNTTAGLTILYPTGNFIELIRMNSTGPHIISTYNITTANSTSTSFNTGIKCSSLTNPNKCYFQTNTKRIYQYIPQTGNVLTYHSSNLSNTEFAVGDVNNDGMNEIAFGADNKAIGTGTGRICLFSTQTGTMLFCKLLNTFSNANHVTLFNIDGIGFSEIIVSEAYTTSYLHAFDVTGTSLWLTTIVNHAGGTSTLTSGTPITSTVGFHQHVRQICEGTDSSFSSVNQVKCVNASTGAVDWSSGISSWDAYRNNYNEPLISVDLNGDGYSDILGNKRMYFPHLTISNYTVGSNTDGFLSYGDISGDAIPEMISQQSGKTFISYGGTISGELNVTIAVRDIDDITVKIPNAIVNLNGEIQITNSNGDATFIVSSLTGNTINITASGYNDYRDFDVTLYETSSYLSFMLMKKLTDANVLDSIYTVAWFDNFSNRGNITQLPSRTGYYSRDGNFVTNLLNTDYSVFDIGSEGNFLRMNSTISPEYARHKSYLTDENSMLYFALKMGAGCDATCDNVNNSNTFYYHFVDITGQKTIGAIRAWYNSTGQKFIIEYYNSNLSFIEDNSASYQNHLWNKCLQYRYAPSLLHFKIIKEGDLFSVYVRNQTSVGNVFYDGTSGFWDSCVIDKDVVTSGIIEYVDFYTSVQNDDPLAQDYIDLLTTANKVSSSCANNTQASITAVGYATGQPMCVGVQQTWFLEISDPENDYYTLQWDCYGNNSFTDWSYFSKTLTGVPCTYNQIASGNVEFRISDLCHYPSSYNTATTPFSVSVSNCFNTGEGGASPSEELSGDFGFKDVPYNDNTNGYTSKYFDMSTCNSWQTTWKSAFLWFCPVYSISLGILKAIFNWIFSPMFGYFLIIILVLVVIVMWKVRKK